MRDSREAERPAPSPIVHQYGMALKAHADVQPHPHALHVLRGSAGVVLSRGARLLATQPVLPQRAAGRGRGWQYRSVRACRLLSAWPCAERSQPVLSPECCSAQARPALFLGAPDSECTAAALAATSCPRVPHKTAQAAPHHRLRRKALRSGPYRCCSPGYCSTGKLSRPETAAPCTAHGMQGR